MILTEAVVACTFGAVAELQVGEVRVGAAAHGAFMCVQVGLLFAPNTCRLFAEVDGVGARTLRNCRQQIAAAKDKKVDNGHDRQEIDREARGNNTVGEERRVNIGKVLYLYRDDVEQQHLHIREQSGVGEEH